MDDDTENAAKFEGAGGDLDGTGAPTPFEQEFPDIEPPSAEDPTIYGDGTTS